MIVLHLFLATCLSVIFMCLLSLASHLASFCEWSKSKPIILIPSSPFHNVPPSVTPSSAIFFPSTSHVFLSPFLSVSLHFSCVAPSLAFLINIDLAVIVGLAGPHISITSNYTHAHTRTQTHKLR